MCTQTSIGRTMTNMPENLLCIILSFFLHFGSMQLKKHSTTALAANKQNSWNATLVTEHTLASLDILRAFHLFLLVELWAFVFAFVSAQGDAAFLHYRQMETWSAKTSGSTCYPSYPLGQKMRARARGEERTERDSRAEESGKPFMWRKQRWMWKGRGNC